MPQREKTISIIGGNTAGCYTALHLAKKADVTIYEQEEQFTKTCSGIVTHKIDDLITIPERLVLNRLQHVTIHFPSKKQIPLRFARPDAVLDRSGFNQWLQDKATQQGATIKNGKRFLRIKERTIALKDMRSGKHEHVPTTHLIGADGALSTVARATGLFGQRHFFTGIKAVIRRHNTNAVELYPFFKDLAWLTPLDDETMEIGILARHQPKAVFEAFCSYLNIPTPQKKEASLIPVYTPRIPTQTSIQGIQTYLIGDAAAQVKATTGGGIVQGMIAARAASQAINTNQDYARLWKRKLGMDLWLHRIIRSATDRFTHKDWELVRRILENKHIQHLATGQSRDAPTGMLFRMLLQDPRLLLLSRRAFA